ncbi:MAG TPA: hypothetical protein VHL34_16685 [Rhizomicrobium sp.]|nr:hypothetical protein [Rhizomicrobium sp.]
MAELPFNFAGPQLDDVLRDPRWFVEDFVLDAKALSFVQTTGRGSLAQEPFLDYRWDRTKLLRQRVDEAALVARFASDAPLPPLNFIWHTSFCCSTLIAETLDAPGRNLSLREPFVLVPLADAKRAGAFTDYRVSPRLPEVVFRLLARSSGDGSPVTVKPSNFANTLVLDAALKTSGKMLFLYSDLASFLTSVSKGRLKLHKYARQLFANIAGDDGRPLPWSVAQLVRFSDLEIAAIAWHLQIAEFQRGWQVLEDGRKASLDCDAFLADPAGTLRALDGFFGFGLGEAHVGQVLNGPLLKRHAKSPGEAFDARVRQAANAAVWREMGADIERIVRWSYEQFPETPRGAPLPGALVEVQKAYS